jgi:hypothetical protein
MELAFRDGEDLGQRSRARRETILAETERWRLKESKGLTRAGRPETRGGATARSRAPRLICRTQRTKNNRSHTNMYRPEKGDPWHFLTKLRLGLNNKPG